MYNYQQAVTEKRKYFIQNEIKFANQTRKLQLFTEQWTDHPRVQPSTSLNEQEFFFLCINNANPYWISNGWPLVVVVQINWPDILESCIYNQLFFFSYITSYDQTRTKLSLLATGFGLGLFQYHSHTHWGGSSVHPFECCCSDLADDSVFGRVAG